MPNRDASLRAQLRQAGLRVTGPRLSVLRWVAEHPHACAEDVGHAVRQRIGSISTQAVYDTLSACTRVGLLQRVEPAGHPARYECRTGEEHHHLVCRDCGRIDDVDRAERAGQCLVPNESNGFLLERTEVLFWGRCPDCAPTTTGARPVATGLSMYEEARR
ncbi:Fur family transcriptional regulator [Lipingzhangella sp. LS1_29]|uniref:Fur family transcriptional regulator n=1 Tax=Lipingzhangella rawalii TaxID=2055835 RepID=A0ABU2H853_9ACTN|nr:Fur family transcriptional regulator [Lipingzhangella rawalii]MDS1271035.1 Fur family transcriptional regulator [Lipingzhangella rawalii]